MRRLCLHSLPCVGVVVRHISQVDSSLSGDRYDAWVREEEPSKRYPSSLSPFPHPRLKFRKTHIEWLLHYGHGERLGKYGPSREISDFEFADGTPASISPRRFAFKHHQDHLLVQLIRAGATVEKYEAEQKLPRVPGTQEQRDWDPEIPLFLDDLEERGGKPALDHARQQLEVTEQMMEEHFAGSTTPINVRRKRQQDEEEMEANTMFASYDPKAFVKDDIRMDDHRRPYWSRRRWALSDDFLVPISPKAKNTIKDE